MAPTRPDLDRLTTTVDTLGTAFATIELETLTPDMVTAASLQASRAANMIDGFRADLARRSRNLQPPGTPPSPRNLNPKHQRNPRDPERDSSRSDLFDNYTELGEATRRGDLPGDYADTITRHTARLTPTERSTFLATHRDRLTKHALVTGLHEFSVHVKSLVDEFCRTNELERFEQQRRRRSATLWNDPIDGMTKLFAQFDPETGARIRKAIDEEVERLYHNRRDNPHDQRTHAQLIADAIANLILNAHTRTTNNNDSDTARARTELIVLIDLHTLITDTPNTNTTTPAGNAPTATTDADSADTDTAVIDDHGPAVTADDPAGGASGGSEPTTPPPTPGAHTEPGRPGGRCCETSDGTALPVEVVRRLACDADIVPAVLNGHGVILDLGRSRRLATKHQRDALATMYTHCAFDGCTVTFAHCEIHHIDPWGPPSLGETNIAKLIPACQRHHHHIHDHHLTLTLDPNTRTLTVTHPDGTRDHHRFHDRRRTPPPNTNDDDDHLAESA